MDISYLLLLQDFRISIGDALTPLMMWLSHFAVRELLLIPVFIYWCVNKKAGLRILFATRLCVGLNAFIKLNFCVYRPWVRDPRVVPAGNAIKSAGGYSFPSGHTTTATPLYGGLAAWQWNRCRAFSWLCIVMLLLTVFSRNYLGVHTPQDVLVGLLLGVCCLWTVARLDSYFQANPG
ncbi:MAG: phosphatase PAP2 family protein, partial [Pyramidobacter sp.]|nr:phosphatase PAP2 family protein [Pyramidobacter sp.]